MTRHVVLAALASVVSLLALVVTSGCEEGIDPFVENRRPFTIWGYLEGRADTQLVRVFTVEEGIGIDRSGPLDAAVTSTDLTTGETYTWTDSLISFGPEVGGHVFWANFRPVQGHRYRLEVMRSDGAMSSAEVTVPEPVNVVFPDNPITLQIPVRVEGDQTMNIVGLGVSYVGVPAFPSHPWPAGTTSPPGVVYPVEISYADKVEPRSYGWFVNLDIQEDVGKIREEYLRNCLPAEMVLQRVEFHLLVANEDWSPPGGVFDPEVLVDPTAMSNVENGFGFFGAGQTVTVPWFPSTDVQRRAGFALSAPCAMFPNPACVVQPPCFRCSESLPANVRQAYCPVG